MNFKNFQTEAVAGIELPAILRRMKLLGIDICDIMKND